MKRDLLLVATVVGAVAFLAWLAWVTPGTPAETSRDAAQVAGAGSSTVAAGAPSTSAPHLPSARVVAPEAAVANPPAVPIEVQEAADRRQFSKITRGMRSNPEGGIRIDDAPAGSVAGEMHLQPGDVLKAVNNEAVSSPEDFARIYRAEGVPGEFVVIRDGHEVHRR